MREIGTFLFLFFLMSCTVFTQSKFGVTTGVTMSNFSGNTGISLDSRTGFAIGLFTDNSENGWGRRIELLYTSKGAATTQTVYDSFTNVNVDVALQYNYIEAPFFIKYTVGKQGAARPYIMVGPYLGFLVVSNAHVKASAQGQSAEADSNIPDQNVFDLGLAFGAGLGFDIGHNVLSFNVRYSFGLFNVNDAEIKNNCLSVMTGLSF